MLHHVNLIYAAVLDRYSTMWHLVTPIQRGLNLIMSLNWTKIQRSCTILLFSLFIFCNALCFCLFVCLIISLARVGVWWKGNNSTRVPFIYLPHCRTGDDFCRCKVGWKQFFARKLTIYRVRFSAALLRPLPVVLEIKIKYTNATISTNFLGSL